MTHCLVRYTSKALFSRILLLLCLAPNPCTAEAQSTQGCRHCHADRQQGFSAAHAALAEHCSQCHAGEPTATSKKAAHHGLIAFPGNMESAQQACGGCHADKVNAVIHNLMHTGTGMVRSTRLAFGEPTDRPGHNDLSHLTHTPADSLLRKQCASCHLGQKKTAHRLDTTNDRGGGCLACHINDQPTQAHPKLTMQVSDARCFGCHSRSGRISLSYAGLAEIDSTDVAGNRLEDGRSVEFRPDDRHHAAGMACIDCHTEKGLMGTATTVAPSNKKQAVDIRCMDCHQITRTISPAQWPNEYPALRARIPYPVKASTRIPVSGNGTPLWHIELKDGNAWLHPKLARNRLRIPPYLDSDHPLAKEHSRLACASCHSQWAPQCYSCHLDYDASGQAYDHAEGHITAGRWTSLRSGIRNDLPPLGVNTDNRVVPVVPGMIMTLTHPDWRKPLFRRNFRSLAPHTTGPARSCVSCHRTSTALGLGEGRLQVLSNGQTRFDASHPVLDDGLPADAWTSLNPPTKYDGSVVARPLSRQEIERILSAPLPPPNTRHVDGQTAKR